MKTKIDKIIRKEKIVDYGSCPKCGYFLIKHCPYACCNRCGFEMSWDEYKSRFIAELVNKKKV